MSAISSATSSFCWPTCDLADVVGELGVVELGLRVDERSLHLDILGLRDLEPVAGVVEVGARGTEVDAGRLESEMGAHDLVARELELLVRVVDVLLGLLLPLLELVGLVAGGER